MNFPLAFKLTIFHSLRLVFEHGFNKGIVSTKHRAINTVRLRRKEMLLTNTSTLQYFFSPHCLSRQRVAAATDAHFSTQLDLHGQDGFPY